MVMVKSHGGGCCGIRHIAYFQYTAEVGVGERADFKSSLAAVPAKRLSEVVLQSSQCTKDRMQMLKDAKFHFVMSFINGNTSHRCNVFHRCVNKAGEDVLEPNRVPLNWPKE